MSKILQTGWKKYKIIVIILLCIFLGVFFCTFLVLQPALFEKIALNNSDAAYIGTFIGGISALIVGSVNVVMLYLAFNQQKIANDLQNEKNKREFEKINSSILKNAFSKIKDNFKLELEGFNVSHWSDVTKTNEKEILHYIFIFLFNTQNHIKEINTSNIKDVIKNDLKSEIKDFINIVFEKNYYDYLDSEREVYGIQTLYASIETLLQEG